MLKRMAFGPTLEDHHGHGGFLSPGNGACLTSGPIPDGAQDNAQSPHSGRKRAREDARAKAINAPGNHGTGSGDDTTNRMLQAMEKSLELTQERMRRENARAKVEEAQRDMLNIDRQIGTIKAMLDESGDLMNDQETMDSRQQLLALRRKSLAMSACDGSEGA